MMNIFISVVTFLVLAVLGFTGIDSLGRGLTDNGTTNPGVGSPYNESAPDLPEAQSTAETEEEVEREFASNNTAANNPPQSTDQPKPSNSNAPLQVPDVTPHVVAALETISQAGQSIKDAFFEDEGGVLSVSEILQLTNAERARRGLPALSYNKALTQMAQLKASDILAHDYFEHVSPQGVGVGELASRVGYTYLLVGENLALGDFRDDEHVVQSWMDSPGHRANMLHEKFSEIGIALLHGEYNGKDTWVVVQEFGLPRSVCAFPDQTLKQTIDSLNTQLAGMQQEIAVQRAQFDGMSSSSNEYDDAYTALNTLISNYNALVASQKTNAAQYNAMVKTYNICIEEKS